MSQCEVGFNWNAEWEERLRKLSLDNVVSCTEALAQRDPSIGATLLKIGNGYAVFHGPRAAMTAAFGMGLTDVKQDEELEAVEQFYKVRNCPVRIWTNSTTHSAFVHLLEASGYKSIGSSKTWIRSADIPLSFKSPTNISVRIVEPTNSELWANTVGLGFSEESGPTDGDLPKWLADMFFAFGSGKGIHPFLAFENSQAVGGGVLAQGYGIAILRTASTRFLHRGKKVQKCLIAARLALAKNTGSAVCVSYTSAMSDHVSAKNLDLFGFQPLRMSTLFEKRS